MDESEYNEYLWKKMKNVSSINNSKKKKRVCRYRGFGAKRGLNLRVKLNRFWVRARITRWLKLRLNCLSRALRSLFSNITTSTTATRDPSNSNSTNKSSYRHDNDHRRYSSFARSNSFYAEAIADCLEFIKRSSSNNNDHHHHHFHDQQQSHQSLL